MNKNKNKRQLHQKLWTEYSVLVSCKLARFMQFIWKLYIRWMTKFCRCCCCCCCCNHYRCCYEWNAYLIKMKEAFTLDMPKVHFSVTCKCHEMISGKRRLHTRKIWMRNGMEQEKERNGNGKQKRGKTEKSDDNEYVNRRQWKYSTWFGSGVRCMAVCVCE